jgi:hypothetical protein
MGVEFHSVHSIILGILIQTINLTTYYQLITMKIYADTSVFGGVFDPEFAAPSQRFFLHVAIASVSGCDLMYGNSSNTIGYPLKHFEPSTPFTNIFKIYLATMAPNTSSAFLKYMIPTPFRFGTYHQHQ